MSGKYTKTPDKSSRLAIELGTEMHLELDGIRSRFKSEMIGIGFWFIVDYENAGNYGFGICGKMQFKERECSNCKICLQPQSCVSYLHCNFFF